MENSIPEGEVIPPSNPRARPHLAAYRFQPGNTGNRNGRPRKGVLTEALQKHLGKRAPATIFGRLSLEEQALLGKKPKVQDLLMWMLIRKALTGDVQATREVLNRMEGRNPHVVAVADTSLLGELQAALLAGPREPGETNDVPEEDEEDDDGS